MRIHNIGPALLGLLVVGTVAGSVVLKSDARKTKVPVVSQATSTVVGASTSSYTLADVAHHATATDCWTVVNGVVYDLTRWIEAHPGGQQAIIAICGADGSAAFNRQHSGQPQLENVLEEYRLGTLIQS